MHLARGAAWRQQQEWAAATAATRAAGEVARAAWGDTLAFAKAEIELGRIAIDALDLAAAAPHLARALAIAERLAPDSLVEADVLARLGIVASNSGQLAVAEARYQRAIELYERLAPDSIRLTATLSNRGVVAWRRGDLALAEAVYHRCLGIDRRLHPGGVEVAGTLTNLALVAIQRRDFELAEEYLLPALATFEEQLPGSQQVAILQLNLGTVAYRRQDLAGAADYYARSGSYFERHAPLSNELASVLNNLGLVAKDRGDLDVAEDFYRRAVEIREELTPDRLPLASSLQNLGTVFLERGELEVAEDHFRRALDIEERLAPGSLRPGSALYSLGRVAEERREFERAAAFYRRALELAERLAPDSRERAQTLYKLGTLARRSGDLEQAAEHFLRACAVFEAQVERFGGSYDALSQFRASHRHLYRDALEAALDLGRSADAFHLLERSRSRILLAMLAERDLTFAGGLGKELEDRRRDLAERYDRALRRWSESGEEGDAPGAGGRSLELAELDRERDQLIAEIRRSAPRLGALQYPQPLDLAQARAALDPGTLMLSYSVGEERSDLFVVSRDADLEVHSIGIGEKELRGEVESLLESLRRSPFPRYRASFDAASRRLYDLLLAPAAAAVDRAERLLVVADGPLHALPFAALSQPADGDGDRYLVEAKPLHSVQSATLYAELRQSRRQAADRRASQAVQLAAFGDPRFPDAVPERAAADPRLRAAVHRGLFDWQALPYSRQEVEAIVELYPKGAAIGYLGEAAIEERAKTLDKNVRVVHFATHALIDDRFPLSSALALTMPEEGDSRRDNGLLQAWEIFESVRLEAELVVLSACGSGLGPELAGEGLLGLTRAFQYAGARSVAASLWSVDDRSTAELMVRFHRHLRAGQRKDEALRSAQLELLREPRGAADGAGRPTQDLSAPFYWAAFQLIGDWR